MLDTEYLDGGQLSQILHVLITFLIVRRRGEGGVSGEGAVNTRENLDSVILRSGGGGNI